ncbi:MAG: AAA family ATPase, partial [Acidobacteria bacterium]|nr:AAA family ATPase [Acidobacteriota bacterium]
MIHPSSFYEQFASGAWDPVPANGHDTDPPFEPKEPMGDKWARLERGEWEGLGYQSQSDADYAFIGYLARKYHYDPALIDEAFRRSGMMREKWNRESYRRITIRKVIQDARRDPRLAEGDVIGRLLSEITEREIEWLWKPYIPKGGITLLSGDPGAGKSFIALSIAAEETKRGRFVLYMSVENPPEEVLVKRFRSLGGNPDLFELLEAIEYGPAEERQRRSITLEDIPALERKIRQRSATLVIVDPVQSYLGRNVDSHRANETRPILDGLIHLAEKHRLAILLLRHCSKVSTGKVLYRGLGSIDFTAAARSELIVGENESQMAMANMKNNLTKKGPTLGYRIADIDDEGRPVETGIFTWTGECELKPEDLVEPEASPEEKSTLQEAVEFLRQTLREGPRLAKALFAEAREAGLSEITLRRARRKAHAQVQKRLGDGRSEWFIPQRDDQHVDQGHYVVNLDQVERVDNA